MRALVVGCKATDHGHQLLLNRRRVDTDDDGLPEVIISLWRCPVLHTMGAIAEFPGPGS